MANYVTKYFGIEASVDAVNRSSADEQLQWLLRGKPCFCTACRDKYYKEYSITLIAGYEPTTTCINDQSGFSIFRFV